MKFDPPIFRLLVINLCLVVSITTGELEYYQDVEPEPSETEVRLKQLERYLELQSRPRIFRRDHAPPHRYPQPYDNDLAYRNHEREILEALVENPSILDLLEKNKQNYINPHPNYNNLQYPRSMSRPYMNVNLEPPSVYEYPKLKIPYPDHRINENVFFENSPRYPLKSSLPDRVNYEDNVESSLERLQDRILALNQKHYKTPIQVSPNDEIDRLPDFTYHFSEPTVEEMDNTFAAKPNDPRYYEKVEHVTRREEPRVVEEETVDEYDNQVANSVEDSVVKMNQVQMIKPQVTGFNRINDNIRSKVDRLVEIMPEPQRRAEREPIITFTKAKVNNDVYFIAIVAGCSAAAMFALVLISLTWCRLQRGVKAAADIEYPAYGVTGPNKDVSPSGDQRLAHSAQMYHFQHQKQQIIAMEKSAASRDPGSISEAESDEENEEGDYTVYECPGLAPAGEVEVKNPMFHDDPTPATPPRNTKDEGPHH